MSVGTIDADYLVCQLSKHAFRAEIQHSCMPVLSGYPKKPGFSYYASLGHSTSNIVSVMLMLHEERFQLDVL